MREKLHHITPAWAVGMAVFLLVLSGCSSTVRTPPLEQLVYVDTSYAQQEYDFLLNRDVSVGRVKDFRADQAQESTQAIAGLLQEALKRSLAVEGLFAEQGGRFQLDASLYQLTQRSKGSMTRARAGIKYTLTETHDNKILLQKTYSIPFAYTCSGLADCLQRSEQAVSGAVRANIAQLLRALAQLKLSNTEAMML